MDFTNAQPGDSTPVPDDFDVASSAARRCARRLLKAEIPAAIVADGPVCQGLAAWAADTGRAEDAAALLAVWSTVRDAH